MITTGTTDIEMDIILTEAQAEIGEEGQGSIAVTSLAMGHEGVTTRF